MEVRYKIYQAEPDFKAKFMPYTMFRKYVKAEILTPSKISNNYKKVYDDTITNESNNTLNVLENIFQKFNVDHPKDFKGHSLSTSDVVVLNNESAWYCDVIGWQNTTDLIECFG